MPITAEVQGRSADHFRAYVQETLTRRPNLDDHKKRLAVGKEAYPDNARVRHQVEQPGFEGPVTLTDPPNVTFTLDAGDKTVTRIVFFKGEGDDAQVVGSAEVNAAGKIEVEMVEPKTPEPEVFDAEA